MCHSVAAETQKNRLRQSSAEAGVGLNRVRFGSSPIRIRTRLSLEALQFQITALISGVWTLNELGVVICVTPLTPNEKQLAANRCDELF